MNSHKSLYQLFACLYGSPLFVTVKFLGADASDAPDASDASDAVWATGQHSAVNEMKICFK